MAYNNAVSTYRETKVKTASQGQLIIMLYDEAVKQLDKGLELLSLDKGGRRNPANIEKISKAILKAEEIVTELTVSLDFEQGGEIAKNLFSLYTWFNQELLESNITQDLERLKSVRNMISDLRSAWSEIVDRAAPDSVGKAVGGINIAG